MALKKENREILLLALILLGVVLISCFSYPFFFPPPQCALPACNGTAPIFNDPEAKLAELSDGNFTMRLFAEASAFEPLINRSGTQVHMGFWSGKGNHGSLVRLLDDINNYAAAVNGTAQKAVWDEGAQSSLQYPSYVAMNAQEHWYERSSQKNGTVAIYGVNYADPYNVTFQKADAIWGEYSERYTEMAGFVRNATGNPVQVWCFVQGAKANRIFYAYEYPALQTLEAQGIVQVHFAKSQDADWMNPDDWSEGTASASPPAN